MIYQHEKKVGLLAGWGRYPLILAEKLTDAGFEVHCLGIHGHADAELKRVCQAYVSVSPTRVGRQLRYMRKHGITLATMAGKIFKTRLFRRGVWLRHIPDRVFVKYYHRHFFVKSKDNNDDALLTVAVNMFADYGIRFAPATDFVPELLVKQGTLTKRALNSSQLADLKFAWELARQMGKLDIGQSVVVKNRAVLAIEAVEGTDECIRRAGQLCPAGGFTIVKVAKPQQDMRFDVPTVGVGTIKAMRDAGGKVLVIEADKTIVLDQQDMTALADQFGIIIVATSDAMFEDTCSEAA